MTGSIAARRLNSRLICGVRLRRVLQEDQDGRARCDGQRDADVLRQFKGLLVGRDHAARDPDVRDDVQNVSHN
jgi:hypothetical protein